MSISGLVLLVSIVIFTAGVVMLVRAKKGLSHSSKTPRLGTHIYEMADDREERVQLGAGVYKEVDKQDS